MTTYISFDIEADGPIPGKNSMLSIGAAAIDKYGNELSAFSVNFEELPNAVRDPNTMEWWQNFLPSYEESRKFVVSPQVGMERLDDWLAAVHAIDGNSVLVASPSALDIAFLRHYYSFVRRPKYDIGFMCFDLQSAMAAYLKIPFQLVLSPKFWPVDWKTGMPPYTHVALDDARFQAVLFIKFARAAGLAL